MLLTGARTWGDAAKLVLPPPTILAFVAVSWARIKQGDELSLAEPRV